MRLSQQVGQLPGVTAAVVAMATELNLDVMAGMGFTVTGTGSANDLVIAVRAMDEDACAAAVTGAQGLLRATRRGGPGRSKTGERSTGAGDSDVPARTIGSLAAREGPGLALISVPGPHAFTEAMDALDSGCDVLIFSDNVGVGEEIALKEAAARAGRLVMGPDCGTAVIGGIGLGFSHTLDRGPVGLVAASGTGAQQVLCLLDAAGVGVSAALGVGGRDLSADVAGRSTLAALRILDEDPDTDLIVVVSKPPADEVAGSVRAAAAQLSTPVEFALLGENGLDLTSATERALDRLRVIQGDEDDLRQPPSWPAWPAPEQKPPSGPYLRGLFCGGTLCDEAMLIATDRVGPVLSNIPLRLELQLGPISRMSTWPAHRGHYMVDFGDDALTVGRAHPMIDPSLRGAHLAEVLADPATGVVLLDVVLGHGAHPDPAGAVADVIHGSSVPVTVSLIGARRDPQSLEASAARLTAAGAAVFASNAAAARHALDVITPVRQGESR
jgi:FdrA protein